MPNSLTPNRTRFAFWCVLGALGILGPPGDPAAAQTPAAAHPDTGIGEILGRLADSATGRAVTGGSITVRRAGDSTFVSGAFPKGDGSFHVDGLAAGRYTLRVRAIGFAPYFKSDITITRESSVVNLGTVALHVVAAKLDAAQIVAERGDVILTPDRTNYDVKNMPAAGGTAIDVLRNVPLVEVDGSNSVTLRGNANVVIQINGRSTPLKGDQLGTFLAQLPAGTMKNVEVATNPSAKDDPEGTAGIINIILNQDARLGLSGGLTAGTASTGQLNASGNIGKQQGKLVLFASGSIYHDRREISGKISRTNLVIAVPSFTETRLTGTQAPFSGGGNVRSEYRFTERSTLSFDAFVYGGRSEGDNASAYTDLNATRSVIGAFNQFQSQASRNLSQDYDLAFRRIGNGRVPLLSTELEYANNYSKSDIELSGTIVQSDASTSATIETERDRMIGRFPSMSWKTDYTHNFSLNTKLETGFKITHRATKNDFNAAYLNTGTGVYTSDPLRATSLDYHEDIGGGYALLSNKMDKVQSQAGLRLEDAATFLGLTLANERSDHRYASAYPSAIISYNFSDLRQARVSYSRRVSRPNPFQLSPVEFRQDTRNVFRGNPKLRAEYTDALELAYQESRSWGSIQLSPYLRSTAHAVRNIQFVDSNGISVSTFDNVASTLTIGADLNINAHHGPLQLGGGGSVYHYSSDASNLSGTLSAHAMVWSARTNATWRLSPKTDAQVYAYYRGPYATEGGSQIATVSMNVGYRYKVWGDKGNIAVRISDPFKLQKFGYRTANGTVVESSERFYGTRAMYLTITRNFGQALKLQPKQQDPDATPQPTVGPPP